MVRRRRRRCAGSANTVKPWGRFAIHSTSSTSVSVPPEFLEPDAEFKFEILAIEESGNQTITESTFFTLP